jgi:hypothetical protein
MVVFYVVWASIAFSIAVRALIDAVQPYGDGTDIAVGMGMMTVAFLLTGAACMQVINNANETKDERRASCKELSGKAVEINGSMVCIVAPDGAKITVIEGD